MELNEYQEKCFETCTTSSNNKEYMLLNLIGEIGELAECFEIIENLGSLEQDFKQLQYYANRIGKVAKMIRKQGLNVNLEQISTNEKLIGELGDCEWQLSGLEKVLNYSKKQVCEYNINKLADRQKRCKIIGNGDFR